jgi:hypothetical protein
MLIRTATLTVWDLPQGAAVGDRVRLTFKQDDVKVSKVDVAIQSIEPNGSIAGVTPVSLITIRGDETDAQRIADALDLSQPFTLNVKRHNGVKVDVKGIQVESVAY